MSCPPSGCVFLHLAQELQHATAYTLARPVAMAPPTTRRNTHKRGKPSRAQASAHNLPGSEEGDCPCQPEEVRLGDKCRIWISEQYWKQVKKRASISLIFGKAGNIWFFLVVHSDVSVRITANDEFT